MSATVSMPSRDAPQYEEFYGFVQSPFTLAPDPRFLYLSESHDAALQLLHQSIVRREGIAVLTGEIGTGKTTVCRAVIDRLDMTTFTSLVLNPFLSVEELLREILLDFGVVSREAIRSGRVASATKHELVSTLHEFLISLMPIGGSGVLIIDEAQHLSPAVLEELRVLSNLETNQSKLLQIVLVGQITLLDVLADPDAKQFDQRVSLRAMLLPLTRAELQAYIGHRLSMARGSSSVNFDARALEAVYASSDGVPRVINQLCDRALMLGAQFGLRVITADVVAEAAESLGLRSPGAGTQLLAKRPVRWASIIAAILGLIVGLLVFVPLHRFVDGTLPTVRAPSAWIFSPPPVRAPTVDSTPL